METKGMLVMLVDDDPTDLFIATRIFESATFAAEIIAFPCVRLALDYLKENKDNPTRLPDLIVLEIYMPFQDGFEFLKSFEKLDSKIKSPIQIITLSSYYHDDDLKYLGAHPLVAWTLSKPLTEAALEHIRQKV